MTKEKVTVNMAPALREYIREETKRSNSYAIYFFATIFICISLYIIAIIIVSLHSIVLMVIASFPFVFLIVITIWMLIYNESKRRKVIGGVNETD